jgi:hypothetical protein
MVTESHRDGQQALCSFPVGINPASRARVPNVLKIFRWPSPHVVVRASTLARWVAGKQGAGDGLSGAPRTVTIVPLWRCPLIRRVWRRGRHEFTTAVPGPGRLVVAIMGGVFFAVGDSGHPLPRYTESDKVVPNCLRPAITQSHVVLLGPPFVAVPFDQDDCSRRVLDGNKCPFRTGRQAELLPSTMGASGRQGHHEGNHHTTPDPMPYGLNAHRFLSTCGPCDRWTETRPAATNSFR